MLKPTVSYNVCLSFLVFGISKLVILFYVFILIIPVSAQNSGIKGYIEDAETKEKLIGATIQFQTTGTATDENGFFSLALAAGSYDLIVSYLGYEALTKNVLVAPNEWIEVTWSMAGGLTILQTAVVSDSRYKKPIAESTISIEVLKTALLEHLNSTSLSSVMDKIPGVIMVGDQANIRGGAGFSYGAGSRVLLMLNDVPALQADAGFPNWDDVPVENIEQIEVIKGAASAIYGSSALNGLIHVRTKYAKSEPITKISSFYSHVLPPSDKSQQWWSTAPYTTGINGSHAQKFGKLDMVLGMYLQKSKSHNQTVGSEYGRLNGSVQYRITDRLSAGVHFNLNRRMGNSFFYWQDGVKAYFKPDTSTKSSSNSFRYHIDPFLTYFDTKNNKHSYKSRWYAVDNIVSDGKSNSSTMYFNEYQFQREFKNKATYLTAGLTSIYNKTNSDLFSRIPFSTLNTGIYAQVDKKIKDHTTITGGWRFEHYNLKRPEVFAEDTVAGGREKEGKNLFRFGLNSKLDTKTYLRASWGQGFRFPTLAEKFITTSFGSTFISPNPRLISETGWNAEIGLKRSIGSKNWNAFVDGALFWSQYQDMMEFIFTGFVKGFQSQNIGNTDIKGFELSVGSNSSWGKHHVSIIGGYNFIEPRFQNFTEEENLRSSADINILKYRSKHLFKLDVEDQVGKWIIGSGVLYNSRMVATDAVFELVIRGLKQFRQNHGGYWIQDLRIARKVNRFTINLIGKNIWNEIYTSRPAIMEAPRNITLRVDYDL